MDQDYKDFVKYGTWFTRDKEAKMQIEADSATSN